MCATSSSLVRAAMKTHERAREAGRKFSDRPRKKKFPANLRLDVKGNMFRILCMYRSEEMKILTLVCCKCDVRRESW